MKNIMPTGKISKDKLRLVKEISISSLKGRGIPTQKELRDEVYAYSNIVGLNEEYQEHACRCVECEIPFSMEVGLKI